MKQHMMTHKIRDMATMVGNSPSSSGSIEEERKQKLSNTSSPNLAPMSPIQQKMKTEMLASPGAKYQDDNYNNPENSQDRYDERMYQPLSLTKYPSLVEDDESSPILKLQEIKIEAGLKPKLPDIEQPLLKNTQSKSAFQVSLFFSAFSFGSNYILQFTINCLSTPNTKIHTY